MCFGFGAPKLRDRIQTIPFKVIPEASRGPQYRGSLIEDVTNYFYFSEARIVGAGAGTLKIKDGATLLITNFKN